MGAEFASEAFVVNVPGWLLILAIICVLGAVITALKGRWGWLLVGLVTGGLIWPLTAFLPATTESIWVRWRARTAERATFDGRSFR